MRNLFFVAIAALLLGQMACKPSDQKTQHGFRFVNHTKGTGVKATNGESVMVHVDTYIGDTLMASTRAKGSNAPVEFMIPDSSKLGKRVPFIYDAALLMGEGDSASVYEMIDSTLRPLVPPSQKDAKEVRYEVKVVQVITKESKAKQMAEAQARLAGVQTMVQATLKDYAAGKLNDKLMVLPSGLKVFVVEPGTGAPVQMGETVKTNYFGSLMDGKMFDNSFQRGQTLDFPVGTGQMIPGFDEGVTKINHGGKAYFFLPSKLAYGEQGNPQGGIPPNTDMVFYVELM